MFLSHTLKEWWWQSVNSDPELTVGWQWEVKRSQCETRGRNAALLPAFVCITVMPLHGTSTLSEHKQNNFSNTVYVILPILTVLLVVEIMNKTFRIFITFFLQIRWDSKIIPSRFWSFSHLARPASKATIAHLISITSLFNGVFCHLPIGGTKRPSQSPLIRGLWPTSLCCGVLCVKLKLCCLIPYR